MFFLKISSFTCPIAHWTMKKLLQTNIINKQKQFWWMKRNLNFIKIKKVEVRVPKITPACYFYARLKILLQNSLHVSLMRPRKKLFLSVYVLHIITKKNCQKMLVKAQNHYVTSTQYFTIPDKNPNYRADNFICN